MLISVMGAGYVGLVTAAALSNMGSVVRCVDISRARIEQLRRGVVPIAEPGLADMVEAGVRSGALSFHDSPDAVRDTALVIIAVGTLDDRGDWTAEHVRRAVLAIASDAYAPRHLVIRSTLMPGTAAALLEEARTVDPRIEIAHNPEFTREGSALSDFQAPDRVVLGLADGSADSELGRWLREIYGQIEAPLVITDLASAETIKIASNVFLAAKIAFANELARLCAASGADVGAVVDGVGLDRRIGRQFLSPGPGFGGACLPSQAATLPRHAMGLGVHLGLMSAIAPSNQDHALWWVEQVVRELRGDVRDCTVAVLGATFKAGTDDLRDSPAIRLVKLLVERAAKIRLYDPVATGTAASALANVGVVVTPASDPYDAGMEADAILVATEWPEFHDLDWKSMRERMRGRVVIDTRSVVDRAAAEAAGFRVTGLAGRRPAGRPSAVVGTRSS